MINSYCTGCHNPQNQEKAGKLALTGMNFDAIGSDAQMWEKVVRKLRGRLMPPPGSKQPTQVEVDGLVGWLEARLDANAGGPKAGHTPIQRMSRTEYIAAVKALVGVDIKSKDILPTDASVEGFDNIASGLSVSPAFIEQYVEAARQIAKQAVGDPSLDAIEYFPQPQGAAGEAMPLGLRAGAMRFKHEFTADGEYRFKLHFPDLTLGLYTGRMEVSATAVIMIDGKIMFKKEFGGVDDVMLNHRKAGDGRQQIQDRFDRQVLQVQAGVREVVIGWIDRSRFESAATFQGGGGGGQPDFDLVEIKGPYKPNGATTVSHRLIFVCDPKGAAEEAPCAKRIAENLARRAFRRPVTDADVARLLPFYEAGRKEQGATFDRGIERLIAAVLASPEFLYRMIRGTEAPKAASEVALSEYELATRLSFFVWNTGPDEELFKLAAAKELSKPAVLDAQVKRMLEDPKASSLVSSFAMKWLGLTGLDTMKPDTTIFNTFNDQLKKDLVLEAETFIHSVLLENKPLVELLTSDRTYLNQRVAEHYGLNGISGQQFRWVRLTDRNRLGLLGKGAVLTVTSYPNRTSPVLRGAWVLDRIIGTPPTPPPPGVEADLSAKAGEAPRTVRARLEQHRDNATCRQCHGVIDPMGLALENFDGVGRYRTTDRQAENAPIDASTVLPSGQPLNGPVELRAYLASDPGKFARAFTEKLMMYAVNRELEYFDMPQVRAVVRNAAKDNYTLSSIVQGIVQSEAFRKQGPAHAPKAAGTKVADNR
jgi:hypothetical protein